MHACNPAYFYLIEISLTAKCCFFTCIRAVFVTANADISNCWCFTLKAFIAKHTEALLRSTHKKCNTHVCVTVVNANLLRQCLFQYEMHLLLTWYFDHHDNIIQEENCDDTVWRCLKILAHEYTICLWISRILDRDRNNPWKPLNHLACSLIPRLVT